MLWKTLLSEGSIILGLTIMLAVSLCRVGFSETIIPIQGIGTSIPGANSIDTCVKSVTLTQKRSIDVQGVAACELRGFVSGIGWGGTGIVSRASGAHYEYEIPFVARWPRHTGCRRLVCFNHGGGVGLMPALRREKLVGAQNSNRTAELNGDLLVGVPALLQNSAYISINRRGLRGDGSFSSRYLTEVPPLTVSETAVLMAELDASPGGTNFKQPGLAVGAHVPLVPTYDVTTCRDVFRALEMVVRQQVGQPFCTRIGVGTSSGARVLGAMNLGRSVIDSKSMRTGGNHWSPYDEHSRKIFDGFILNGFPYDPLAEHVDADQPLSAPMVLIQGQGDERYQQHISLAHELMKKNVKLNGSIWIYEIKNLTHVTRDNFAEVPASAHGDRLACFLSSAIGNLACWIECCKPMPCSRIAGRVIEGALRFDQVGNTTSEVPVPQDSTIDSLVLDVNLKTQSMGPSNRDRWLAVTTALPHVPDAITPPSIACRLGGSKLKFFGVELVPMSATDLQAKYGSFAGYQTALIQSVRSLETQRLYDSRVEPPQSTAELARALFATSDNKVNP